jgi:hypothetical protein
MCVLSASGLGPPIIFGNARQNNWRTVWELSHKRQVSTHGLDSLPQRREQQIAPFFEARNTVLRDPESFGHPDLRELARVPQLAQGHLIGYQLSSAGLNLLALGGAQLPDYVIHVRGHGYFLSFLNRAR